MFSLSISTVTEGYEFRNSLGTCLTYFTLPNGQKIKLTKSQINALKKAKRWPHDKPGQPYASTGKPF